MSCDAGRREVASRDKPAELNEIYNWVSSAVAPLDRAELDLAELCVTARRAGEIADAEVAASARKVQTTAAPRHF